MGVFWAKLLSFLGMVGTIPAVVDVVEKLPDIPVPIPPRQNNATEIIRQAHNNRRPWRLPNLSAIRDVRVNDGD